MPRTVSSVFTPLWKVVFPLYFVLFASGYSLALTLEPGRASGGRSWPNVLFELFIWPIVAFLTWHNGRLTRVKLDESGLTVFYLRAERVSFASITAVIHKPERGKQIPTVTVTFRRASGKHGRAVFVPRGNTAEAAEMVGELCLGAGVPAEESLAPADD